MKRSLLVLATLLCVAACSDSSPTDNAEGKKYPWMHRDKFFDVTFVGEHAWVVGYPGVILHTPDRGETWEAQEGGLGEALFAVDFVDESTGWISGRRGLVLHTKDGGKSWAKQETGCSVSLLAVDFVDAQNGWVVGDFLRKNEYEEVAQVWHTSDGGETWSDQNHGEIATPMGIVPVLNGVSFVNDKRGWIAGEYGSMFETKDGGASWTRLATGTERHLFDVRFRGEKDGVVVGSAGTVLQTEDGGETWTDRSVRNQNPLFNAHFAGGRTWACGQGGTVVQEGKFGLESERTGDVYVWLSAISFSDDGQTGLAVGRAGTIVRTADGGETWSALSIQR